MSAPIISVIMPVYNGEKYLREAIDSILNQSYYKFEFIIINDGSTDQTLNILHSYDDPRILLINQNNQGVIASLNSGVSQSRGKYIARMDSDDISFPERLEKQFYFLENHPDYHIVGTTFLIIDEKGSVQGINPVLLRDQDLRREILIETIFGHGTVMMKKEIVQKLGLYRRDVIHVEDYDLWVRFSKVGKVANLQEVLYLWRDHTQSISRLHSITQLHNAQKVQQLTRKNFLELQEQDVVNLHDARFYRNEIIEYDGSRLKITRRERFASVHALLSYHAFQQRLPLLSIRLLIMSILIDPLILIKTFIKYFR